MADPGFDNLWAFQMGAMDTMIYAQSVALLAEEMGLGTCFYGGTISRALPLIDFFECPKRVVPLVTLVMGYPEESEKTKSKRIRLPKKSFIQNEKFAPITDSELIELYREKEELEWPRLSTSDEHKDQVEDEGIQTLAEIYTRLKYPKTATQDFSENYLEAMKRQRFLT